MAKKKTIKTLPASEEKQMRICFERIIPDHLDAEKPVRHALRDFMVSKAGGKLNPDEVAHVAKMAVITSKKWPTGSTIKCSFLDGSTKMKTKVRALAHQWEKYAKIKFLFVSSGASEIRISFYADNGSWSAVGRDALNTDYFPLHQPTMNYGWLRDNTSDEEYARVVLHEFGHALGCIHEHQSPKFTRKWNTAGVMQAFQGPPNFWSVQDINHNVLLKYSPQGISATNFDPKSIMLYDFDAALFTDNLGPTNSNKKISRLDIQKIKSMYP